MEGVFAYDCERGPRHRVRGRHRRALPPPRYQVRQGARAQRGLLPTKPTQPNEPLGHHPRIPRRHLFPR